MTNIDTLIAPVRDDMTLANTYRPIADTRPIPPAPRFTSFAPDAASHAERVSDARAVIAERRERTARSFEGITGRGLARLMSESPRTGA